MAFEDLQSMTFPITVRGAWGGIIQCQYRDSRTHLGGGGTPIIRQYANYWAPLTAHPATSSTAPAHQLLGTANAETTPAGAPAAAADRTQRPDATCEGKNG